MTYIGLRFSLASLGYILVTLFSKQGRRWPTDRTVWRQGLILGVFGSAIPMTLMVSSLNYLSSGVMAILVTVNPAFTVLLANFFLPDEPLSRRKFAGVALALGGAMLLALLGESGLPDVSQAQPVGYWMVLIALVVSSSMFIYVRKYARDTDTFQVTTIRTFVAALTVMPLSFLLVGFDLSRVNSQGYFALGWASIVGTFFAILLSFYNVKRFGASSAAMTSYVVPVIASIGGVLLLGETVTTGMLGAMLLIVLGITILNTHGRGFQEPSNI
jgi:drug/metabolite transporter (DMT)-like permease